MLPSFCETQLKVQMVRPHLRHNGLSENGLECTLEQFPAYLPSDVLRTAAPQVSSCLVMTQAPSPPGSP